MHESTRSTPLLLKLLVRNAPSSALIAFTALSPKGADGKRKATSKFFPATEKGVDALFRLALQHDARKHDCYVQCTLLKRKPVKGRGIKADVLGTSDLYVDVDREEKPNGDLTPTLLVNSGNGWHLHFGLSTFLNDIDAIEATNKRLALHYQADDCWDACRLLRIPGTHNHKDPKRPKPVTELVGSKALHAFPKLVERLPEDDAVDLTAAEGGGSDEGALTVDGIPKPSPITDADLDKLSQSAYHKLTSPKENTDRSNFDYHMGNVLMSSGWSINKVCGAMLDERFTISRKTLANSKPNLSYLKLTIGQFKKELVKSGLAPRKKAPLAQLIYDKRRAPDGKLIIGQPDSDWCDPCVVFLHKNLGVTFRRDVDDPDRGFIGTTEGLLESDGTRFDDWLQEMTGYTRESHIHGTLKAWLQVESRKKTSHPVKLRPWIVLERPDDLNPSRLSIAADLEGSRILEVSLEPDLSWTTYPNGTKELLLRTSNRLHKPIPAEPPMDEDDEQQSSLHYLRETFTDVLACSKVSREILTAYLLAAPLTRGFGIVTLPLLYLTGTSGSGKTQTLKLISTYFHGTHKVLGDSTVASMYRGAAAEIFVPFDDYDNLSEAIKGFILSTTTGAERQKSEGKNDVVAQDLHVLLAFTSTKELMDEPLRRRALRIEINKSRWANRDQHFSEEHWKKLVSKRDVIWWSWFRFLSRIQISSIMENFEAKVEAVEKLISVDSNRPLAGFLTLLYTVVSLASKDLGLEISPIQDWLMELQLQDEEQVHDRHDIWAALDTLFETVMNDPGVTNIFDSAIDIPHHLGNYMDQAYSLDMELQVDEHDHKWLYLTGTTSSWWNTLRHTTKGGYRVKSAIAVGHDFKALIGESPDHSKDKKTSKTYRVGRYQIEHITNAGKTYTSRGWRIAVCLPKER